MNNQKRADINIIQHCRVLCVDDHALTMHLLSLILQQQGYEVLTSSDPTMAIKVLKQGPVDLALLDYEMPHMNGGELAAFVKHEDLATKVILFSGKSIIPHHHLAFVDRFVQKSEGVEALLEAVESLLPITKRTLAEFQQQ
ncbi:MAG TPA: response regulator [Terriglobales bacterium]|nr:response regulator [Terriglobales bacterium]